MGALHKILNSLLGFVLLIALWWLVAKYLTYIMPVLHDALNVNIDFFMNPFYIPGPGDVGIGFLLLESLRRVLIGFVLGCLFAIPLGVRIGLSKTVHQIFNPMIQVLKPVSPVASLTVFEGINNVIINDM